VNPASGGKLGDGRVNLSVYSAERRASGRPLDVDTAVDASNIQAAFDLADGHVAVHAVGCERDFARQLQHYALVAFWNRAERREDAAPVFLDADAKLARIVVDFDLAELQVPGLPGRADDQNFGVIDVSGLDINSPVNVGDDDVRVGLERIAAANLFAFGEINAFVSAWLESALAGSPSSLEPALAPVLALDLASALKSLGATFADRVSTLAGA